MFDDKTIEIKNFAVSEEVQGRGYGKQLMQYAIEYCSQHGYKKIIAGTGNSSLDNLAFYQKVGFRFASIVRDFFVTQQQQTKC